MSFQNQVRGGMTITLQKTFSERDKCNAQSKDKSDYLALETKKSVQNRQHSDHSILREVDNISVGPKDQNMTLECCGTSHHSKSKYLGTMHSLFYSKKVLTMQIILIICFSASMVSLLGTFPTFVMGYTTVTSRPTKREGVISFQSPLKKMPYRDVSPNFAHNDNGLQKYRQCASHIGYGLNIPSPFNPSISLVLRATSEGDSENAEVSNMYWMEEAEAETEESDEYSTESVSAGQLPTIERLAQDEMITTQEVETLRQMSAESEAARERRELVASKVTEIFDTYIKTPFLPSTALEKDVPSEAIQGAFATAFVSTALLGASVPLAAVSGLATAYLSITKTPTGKAMRTIGELSSNTFEQIRGFWDKVQGNERLGKAATSSVKALLKKGREAVVDAEVETTEEDDSAGSKLTAEEEKEIQRVLEEAADAEREFQEASKALEEYKDTLEKERLLRREADQQQMLDELNFRAQQNALDAPLKAEEDLMRLEDGLAELKALEAKRAKEEARVEEERRATALQERLEQERIQQQDELARLEREQKVKAKAEAEAKAKAEAEAEAKAEAESKAKAEAEAKVKAKAEAEAKAKAEAEAKAKAEAEAAAAAAAIAEQARLEEEERQRIAAEAEEVKQRAAEKAAAEAAAAAEAERIAREEAQQAEAEAEAERERIAAEARRAVELFEKQQQEQKQQASDDDGEEDDEIFDDEEYFEDEELEEVVEDEDDLAFLDEMDEDEEELSAMLAMQLDAEEFGKDGQQVKWDKSEQPLTVAEEDSSDEIEEDLPATPLIDRDEEIARLAREAVEMYEADLVTKEKGGSIDDGVEELEEIDDEDEDDEENMFEEEEEVEELVNWEQLTVAQLKDELRARKLKVSGRKAELIQRLVDYEEG